MLGTVLGHFRILSKLGEGGMGAVYRAYDERLEREVAVKVLAAGATGDDNARRRFRKEALALSQLNHPNIATVFDFDSQNGVDFLVLELIPGSTLQQAIAEGPISGAPFHSLASQLVQGLEAAHERGIVHRDLKPANLQITPEGRLKILDFGLAVLRGGSSTSATVTMTNPTVIAGTLPYMAPEQLRGAAVDSRADIYAAGAVLYEMLTGRRAYPQRTASEIIAGVLHSRVVVPPGRVGKIVARCLEKEPGARYQSVRELRLDLSRLQTPTSSNRNVARRSSAGRGVAVLPLQSLSSESDQADFAEGLTEALISDLARVTSIRVISRYSVMQYKDGRTPLARIARALRVDSIVLGSVLRSGNRMRITVQLIDPATERHRWAEVYEREVSDVLKVQAEITRAISAEIQVRLSATEEEGLANRRTVNPVAYERYLRGRILCSRLNGESNLAGIALLQQGIEIDPSFAPAHATLALACVERLFLYEPGQAIWVQRARTETEIAMRLDPRSAEAHVARGRLLWTLQNNFPHLEAIREFREASHINPSLDEAFTHLAVIYNHIGLFDEGIRAAQRATAINPSGIQANGHLVMAMLWNGRYAEAVATAATLPRGEVLPSFAGSQQAWALARLGRKEEALQILEGAKRLDPSDTGGFLSAFQALLYAEAGDEHGAEEKIQTASAKKAFGHFHHAAFFIACAYAQLGRPVEALEWSAYTAEHGFPCYPLFATEPGLDPVREDVRFASWLASLKREWEEFRLALFPQETKGARGKNGRAARSSITSTMDL
ncbi:MAG: protein kinase [Bryobacteraceae bacterium]